MDIHTTQSCRTQKLQESETDQGLYSNIFYLKQFTPNRMGGYVLILQNSLIPNSLRA